MLLQYPWKPLKSRNGGLKSTRLRLMDRPEAAQDSGYLGVVQALAAVRPVRYEFLVRELRQRVGSLRVSGRFQRAGSDPVNGAGVEHHPYSLPRIDAFQVPARIFLLAEEVAYSHARLP